MIIDTKFFSKFYDDNKEVFNYTNTYPINEINFTKWINNHSDEYKPLASEFREKTRHVSYTEFKGKLGQVIADIVKFESRYNKIILFVYPNLEKSNFFISLYIFGLLYLNDNIKPRLQIITDTNDMYISDSDDLIILPDDASYTGGQFKSFFSPIHRHTKGTFFLAIPYISNQAYRTVSSFFTYILDDPQDRVLFSSHCDKFEKFIENSDPRYSDYAHINSSRYTIYFDHKLADSVSIYQLVYAMGIDGPRGISDEPVTGDPNFKYEHMSLIENCKPITDADKTVFDIQQYKVCPPPFYKLYKYKHNGVTIKNIGELIESKKENEHNYTHPPPFDFNYEPQQSYPYEPQQSYPYEPQESYEDLPPPPFSFLSRKKLSLRRKD